MLQCADPSDVPHVYDGPPEETSNGLDQMKAWLLERGFFLVSTAFDGSLDRDTVMDVGAARSGPMHWFLSGKSRNGCNHVVICKGKEIVHDTSIDQSGIVSPSTDGLWWIEWLVGLPPCDASASTSSIAGEVDAAPHSDDIAVDRFALAMKAKLAAKRSEGYGGWDDPDQCDIDWLSHLLASHVDKGDPVDIGNFAMMIHQRGAAVSGPRERQAAELLSRIPPDRRAQWLIDHTPARAMTDDMLVGEIARIDAIAAKGFGSHSGSPGEWYYERLDELDTEQQRRAGDMHSARGLAP